MKERALAFLRVPPKPDPPPGAPGSLRTFLAADRFFYYQVFLWGATQFGGLVGLLFGASIVASIPPDTIARTVFTWLEILAWIAYAANIPVTLYLVRLDYEMRWYMVTDRSLRIREGIVRVKEKTMTFANIQNLSIRQGPLQRLLEIQDLEVQTAGGGGSGAQNEHQSGESMHIAKFRGVANAEEIREVIREGMLRHRDTGLGDPDERRALPTRRIDATEAARVVLDEARALRRALDRA